MATFAYSRDIPEANNDPSVDQPDMKINTNSIDDLIDEDHVGFNLANGGLHRQVTLLNKTNVLNPTGQLGAFTFNGNTWPGWTNALGTTLMLGSATLALTNGYASLPGGILIQWGRINAAGASGTINFPIAFPTAAFTVTTSYNRVSTSTAHTVYTTSLSASGFDYESSSASITNLYWIAIGN